MVAPAVIALIIIATIAVILFVIALALFIATANQLEEGNSDKTTLLAAGAMMGIAIPFIIVGAIFGVMRFSSLNKGEKKPVATWMFIILSSIGGILVFISTIIGFAVASHYDDDKKRNLQAAGAMAMIGALFFVIAFIVLLVVVKQRKLAKTNPKQIETEKKTKAGFAQSSVAKRDVKPSSEPI